MKKGNIQSIQQYITFESKPFCQSHCTDFLLKDVIV